MTREEERALIARVLDGDTDAFEALVRANEKGVYNLALRMLGNEQDALDASQEAFFRAYRSLDRFQGSSKLSVWLYRVTSNVCLDMLRKASRRRESPLTDEDGQDLPLPDDSSDPQRELEKLVLRDVNGLAYDEIAQVTGLEPGTVKSRIFRARRKLAALLERDGNFFGVSSSDSTGGKGGGQHAGT